MTRLTPLRVAAAVATWAALCAVGLVFDLHPSVLAVAALVVGFSALVWTLLDLSRLVRTPQWSAHLEEPGPDHAGDPRLTRLYSTLRKAPASPAAAAELAADLRWITQNRLAAGPATAVGGGPQPEAPWPDPALRLLDDPTSLPTDPAALSALLDRIEAL